MRKVLGVLAGMCVWLLGFAFVDALIPDADNTSLMVTGAVIGAIALEVMRAISGRNG